MRRKVWAAVGMAVVLVVPAGAKAPFSLGGMKAVFAEPVMVKAAPSCRSVVFEGEVKAGQGFQKVFAPGLEFDLEAMASGWMARVLPVGVARGPHDWAELATPPYQSVTPLAVSTDFAFRAQDAVGWNPRRFRYAGDAAVARRLGELYRGVLRNDAAAMAEVAKLTQEQPQGQLEILNAVMEPGSADQWKMAAAVASHFETTPHEVVQGAKPSPLGKVDALRFRVRLELPKGAGVALGVTEEKNPCRF